MSISLGLSMVSKRFQNVLLTSDNKQWTARESGLSELKAPDFHPENYPDQLHPVPPTDLL
jgi:hypothetical protein